MIVTVQFPPNTVSVKYGRISMQPDDSAKLEVPDYVAFTLCKLSGVTLAIGSASGSAAALLAAADQDWEANYLLQAYGKPLINGANLAAAIALMNSNGEPNASLS